MFVVILTYLKPTSEIEVFLQEHRDFLDKHYAAGRFIASGAQNPRVGGIILANSMNRAELDIILSEDPFHREQIAEYKIIEFNPTKCAVGLEEYFL